MGCDGQIYVGWIAWNHNYAGILHVDHSYNVTLAWTHARSMWWPYGETDISFQVAHDDAIRQVPAQAGNASVVTARDDTFPPYARLPGVTTLDAVYATVPYATRYFPARSAICRTAAAAVQAFVGDVCRCSGYCFFNL